MFSGTREREVLRALEEYFASEIYRSLSIIVRYFRTDKNPAVPKAEELLLKRGIERISHRQVTKDLTRVAPTNYERYRV